jgi:hypothetical protein
MWGFLCCAGLSLPFVSSCGKSNDNQLPAAETAPVSVALADPMPPSQEESAWHSTYYCPVSGIILGMNDIRGHGTTIFKGLPANVDLRVEKCQDFYLSCIELRELASVSSRDLIRIVIPNSLGDPFPFIDNLFLIWRKRNNSKVVEFLWRNEPEGTAEYGYTLREGRLESFWGFDFTAEQGAGLGEACHLIDGDGLLGVIDLK